MLYSGLSEQRVRAPPPVFRQLGQLTKTRDAISSDASAEHGETALESMYMGQLIGRSVGLLGRRGEIPAV